MSRWIQGSLDKTPKKKTPRDPAISTPPNFVTASLSLENAVIGLLRGGSKGEGVP